MDKETFSETIRQHYADEIHEAFLECEHDDGRSVDLVKLNQSLARLMANAKAEGLSPRDFEELVKSCLPQIFDRIKFPKIRVA